MSQQINTINATCQNVPNRNVSRRARRSEETRARIFKAALELFAERGFNAATIEAITEAADVGKGTFFNYFENKESLLLEFREMQMGRVKTFVADNMKSKASLNKLIYDLAVTMTEEQRKSPVLFQSLITAVFTNETIKQRMSEGLSRSRQMLGDLIACRQQRGEIRSDIDPDAVAHSFQKMIFGTMLIWSLSPNTSLEEHLQKMTDVLINGIQSAMLTRDPNKGINNRKQQ